MATAAPVPAITIAGKPVVMPTMPAAASPAPDPSPVLELHRGADGFVNFRVDSHRDDIFSIPAGELREMFPSVRHHLTRDAYFSINGFWKRGMRVSSFDPSRQVVSRRQENLRYLNACFTDLDGYQLGMSTGQLTGEVLDAINAGLLPSPSLLANSGRGIWLFWLLRDRDAQLSHLPQRAFGNQVDLYCKVQRAIADRLSRFKSDSKGASRVARVPGSLNGKSDVVVRYMVLGDDHGRGFTYTLRDLADRLGIRPKEYHPKVKAALDDPESAKKLKAWCALQANRLRQMEKLRSLRGGFREGCRNRAAMLFVHFLTRNGVAGVELERQLEDFADECRPPLSNSERRGALASGARMKTGKWSITNQLIADWLDITPDESDQLETWPAAPRFGDPSVRRQTSTPATRDERREARHEAIREILARLGGRIPSLRAMADLLREELGYEVTHVTVRSDYQTLELATPSRPPASGPATPDLFKGEGSSSLAA